MPYPPWRLPQTHRPEFVSITSHCCFARHDFTQVAQSSALEPVVPNKLLKHGLGVGPKDILSARGAPAPCDEPAWIGSFAGIDCLAARDC